MGVPLGFTGLQKLTTLNVEGCNITDACFESISGKKNVSYFSFHFTFLNLDFRQQSLFVVDVVV